MRRFNLSIVIFWLICSCTDSKENSRVWDFDYEYEIRIYDRDSIEANLQHVEYYDAGKRIRDIGREEGCMRFLYDSSGRLTESIWGRNCKSGVRQIMMYDSNYNLLGIYRTQDSLVNLDTVKYRQIYFYDSSNNLIKELDREWNDQQGQGHEQWNFYSYDDGKRLKELNIQDENDLLWTGTYKYDSNNNLESIHKVRNQTYWTKTFKYDSANRLIEEEIKSNEYPLTEDVSHSAGNNKTQYQHHSDGHLIVKRNLSHKGKVVSKTLYIRRQRV